MGGAEVLVSRFVRHFREQYRVVVVCLDEIGQVGHALVEDGTSLFVLGRQLGFDWRCVRRLRRLVAAEQIDLIHAHQCTPFAYALATRFFGPRPPVLLTEHGRFFPDYPSRKRKWFHRLLADPRDRYIAVGKSVRQALIDNEGLPQARVEVVYNGVDFESWSPSAGTRQAARAQLGVSENSFVVLQVARLDPIKDHATALRAIELANRRNGPVHLFIVGEGPQRAEIEQHIRNRSLGQRVTMLGLRNDVRNLLAAADAFLLTSVSEGIPVTVLEAMAAEVPVVATNVGGLPELVCDGTNGLLAPPGDASKLAEAILRLTDAPALAGQLASRAKRRVEMEFSESGMIGAYERIYAEMFGGQLMAA
jgi:glycosyltransferase involved in cell wall biosynthesis